MIPGEQCPTEIEHQVVGHWTRMISPTGVTLASTCGGYFVDRTPFPLPEGVRVPIYFTVQPGGAYVEPQGARVIYPNYMDLAPGTRVDFWNYDPARKGWHVYGQGTVTADGKQVVPDPGVRVYELSGAMISLPVNVLGMIPAALGRSSRRSTAIPLTSAPGCSCTRRRTSISRARCRST